VNGPPDSHDSITQRFPTVHLREGLEGLRVGGTEGLRRSEGIDKRGGSPLVSQIFFIQSSILHPVKYSSRVKYSSSSQVFSIQARFFTREIFFTRQIFFIQSSILHTSNILIQL
jgi:hypothetical protein